MYPVYHPVLPWADAQELPFTFKEQVTRKSIPKHPLWAWASTLSPLILHFIISIGITIFVVNYVNGRYFNLTERRPLVSLAGGVTARSQGYVPLQSDVVTFLSATLVVLRVFAAAWAGSLCWRGAFFLMERTGLRRRDLNWMISYGLFTPLSYGRDAVMFCVGVILLVTLLAQVVSPILTGSITWIPSNRLAEVKLNATVQVPVVRDGVHWNGYSIWAPRRRWTVRQAAGYASLAWGRNIEKDVMKRVLLSAAGLHVNSTITNMTLPYFSVTALEWIANPSEVLPPNQLDVMSMQLSVSEPINPLRTLSGALALLPDAAWSQRPFPSPSIVSETRTLALYTSWQSRNVPCGAKGLTIASSFPPNMGFVRGNIPEFCYAFARVTYSAGAGVCTNCRVSSPLTVRGDSTIELKEDFMTTEALQLMPDIIADLVLLNSSIPSTWSNNIDDYVIDMLARSYSGAWTALTNYMGGTSRPLTSSFSASIPSVRAQVDLGRVCTWLGLQLLLTFSGIIFLIMQSRSKYQLIGDTTLAAFELDTTEATTYEGCRRLNAGGLLELEQKFGGLKVVVN